MAGILILYSTTDGHTVTICKRIKQVIEAAGDSVTLVPIFDWRRVNLTMFDKIVVGASIRYGKHQPVVFEFIRANQALLDARPSAFFSVNIVARKPAKNRPDTNPYVQKFLRQTPWRPHLLAVFAGRLNYPAYGWLDRFMIRLIMWITDGPTDPSTVVEFTDWRQVEKFASTLAEMG